MISRIDPHTHSAISDGTDTPSELMRAAAASALDVVGLTDHDTVLGWDEAAAVASETGVSLLRGMEMSCSAQGITVHLLSYLHDPNDEPLNRALAQTITSRKTRARRMVENLSADYPITWEEVQRWAPDDGPVGRPHIADALVAAGAFANRNQCFEWALHPRGPYYVRPTSPDAVEATRMVVAAGGVPVLAHPRARQRQRVLPTSAIVAMVEVGLAGLECYHRDHSGEDVAECLALAAQYNLLVTGSSDYHGSGKPNRLGENLTSAKTLEEIAERGTMEVIWA